MEKFNLGEFLKTDKGRIVLVGLMSVLGVIAIYFMFFNKESKEEALKNNVDPATFVTAKDTSFKGRGDVYSELEPKEKKIVSENDFFSQTQELKSALGESGAKSQEDLDKMADSILKANHSKVNYGQSSYPKRPNYSPSGSVTGYSSSPKIDKEKKELADIERFRKESNASFSEFFDGANSSKSQKTSSGHTGSSASQKQNISDAMIYGVISGDQVVKNRDRVTMKLTRDALINGEVYRKNTFLYGIATFTQNRVNLVITNINQKPVSLSVQDAMDGNKGIYIEGESLVAETTNEAVTDGVRDFDIKGIPVGKTIKRVFTKKQKEAHVQLLNNYKIILKSEQ